eukprot:m.41981 g.41981  ORF g.41981 m.41981 type:complete len:320 (+) comp6203_c0_seq1:72-1031(+)
MPKTPSAAVRSVLGLSGTTVKSTKRRKDLVTARTPKGGIARKKTKTPTSHKSKTTPAGKRKATATRAGASASRQSEGKERVGYRLAVLPPKTTAKWQPLSASTIEHAKSILDTSLRVILSAADRTRNRDADEQLMELRGEMLAELEEIRAPPGPKRRRLGVREMEERNRRDEESLFETYREIRALEAELNEQTNLMDADEDELDRCNASVETPAERDARRKKELHPALRHVFERRGNEASSLPGSVTVDTRWHRWGVGTGGGEGAGSANMEDGTDDDETDALAERLCDKLERAEERMTQFRDWLGVTHDVAAAVPAFSS